MSVSGVVADTIIVSKAADGTVGDDESVRPSISADGRWVAFTSRAQNLVADATNEFNDVFVADTVTGEVRLVSRGLAGAAPSSTSYNPDISADGRFIAFDSQASNLVPGDFNGHADIFVYDRDTDADGIYDEADNTTISRINMSLNGTEPTLSSQDPAISDDGRFVVFQTQVNYDPADTNLQTDVYLFDRDADENGIFDERGGIEITYVNAFGDERAESADLSGDGSTVIFNTQANTFAGDDTNDTLDVFVYDVATADITLINRKPDGTVGSGFSAGEGLTRDGRIVLFVSASPDLVANDTNGAIDVFMYNRDTGIVSLVSASTTEAAGDRESGVPGADISADGRFVIFPSDASDLVGDSFPGFGQLFVRDRLTATNYAVSADSLGNFTTGSPGFPVIAGDGGSFAFQDFANNLAENDDNGTWDVFHTDFADMAIVLADPPDPALATDPILFEVSVQNNGAVPATNVVVAAAIPPNTRFVSGDVDGNVCAPSGGDVECLIADLDPGRRANGTLEYAIEAEGDVELNATVTADLPDPAIGNSADTETTVVTPATQLSVTAADAADPLLTGDQVVYTVVAANAGPLPATGLTLTAVLSAGLETIVAGPDAANCTVSGSTVTCLPADLAVGADVTVTVQARAASAGVRSLTASIAADQVDPDADDDTATQETLIEDPAADLAVSVADDADPILTGETVAYSVEVANEGPQPATNVRVVASLSPGLDDIVAGPASADCTVVDATVTCLPGDLALGSSVEITVTATAVTAGTNSLTATATADEVDPESANDSATQGTATLDPTADIAASVSDATDPVVVGSQVSYTVTASNAGPQPATGVRLTATLSGGLENVTASPASAACTVAGTTVTCEPGDVASGGSVTVTIEATASTVGTARLSATASADQVDGAAGNNTASQATTVNAEAAPSGGGTGNGDGGSGGGGGGGSAGFGVLFLLACYSVSRLRRYRG